MMRYNSLRHRPRYFQAFSGLKVEEIEMGDFDNGDKITIKDVWRIARHVNTAGLTNPNLCSDWQFVDAQGKPTKKALLFGDMNLNGEFDQVDLAQIIKMWGKYTIDDECLVPPLP